jgi:hypothetical protein
LFPLILSLDDESLDDLTFCRHELAEFDTFVLEYLDELIYLELRECWNSVNNTLLLKCRE